ncbi:MAG: VOC family protein [Actinomycetota bacterium]
MNTMGHAVPCWNDLSTADVAGAEAFYRALLGWDITRSETPMGDYLTATVDARRVAGMMAKPPEAAGTPSEWTVFFRVDGLDGVVGRVASAGGSVVRPPFEIPGGGRVSVVADTTGAMFGLLSDAPQPGPHFSTEPGAVGWFELMSRDPEAAIRFYTDLLGWEAATSDAEGVAYTVFSAGDAQIAGMIATPDEMAADIPDSWSLYFAVADCEASVAAVVERGGAVIKPPAPTPMGPFAVVADPQGAVFQIMQFDMPLA